jgi:hypothetical protein
MGHNGNGGQGPDLWMVQQQGRYHGGELIELIFLVKTADAVLQISRAHDDRLPYGQRFLAPIEVACPTLRIEKQADKFEVVLSAPKKKVAWHRVVARFRAPQVRTMKAGIVVGSYRSQSGSSRVLGRCVVLVPKPEDKKAPVKMGPETVELMKLQGAWDCYVPKTTKGNVLLVHGNRIFIMPYEDDERLEPLSLVVARRLGADTFTLEKKDGKRYIVLGTGGRLEYTLENRALRIVQPARRKDIWGLESIRGEYRSGAPRQRPQPMLRRPKREDGVAPSS